MSLHETARFLSIGRAVSLLAFASLLPAQVSSSNPGNMTVTAGALQCGAVRRSATDIQTYCYARDQAGKLQLVHNAIDTTNPAMILIYQWCVADPTSPVAASCTGVTPSTIEWEFSTFGSAINWKVTIQNNTVPGLPIQFGSFAVVYGQTCKLGTIGTSAPFMLTCKPWNPELVAVGGPISFDSLGYPHNAAHMEATMNCCLP